MYDPLIVVHYESSSAPFVDWNVFNLIDRDQIPQLQPNIFEDGRYHMHQRTSTWMQLVTVCLSCFFVVGCPFLERRSCNKEKRKKRMKIIKEKAKEINKETKPCCTFSLLNTCWSFA
jgi:ATP-dependent Zn protease